LFGSLGQRQGASAKRLEEVFVEKMPTLLLAGSWTRLAAAVLT
jgi:hypothetical protein